MLILGIETSCDETSAAVVRDGQHMLSNIIASQADIHAQFGGVVPEVAARSHIGEILPTIQKALDDAGVTMEQIDVIAVTKGPGLIGSLLIGVLTAKTLAQVYNKPLVGVNHIIAHAFAHFLITTSAKSFISLPDGERTKFPLLALTVSGGHTALTLYQDDLSFEVVGQTQDDAAGEAFDKIAKLLGLSYPGGPAIAKAAEAGDENAYSFPIAKMQNELDFSFSGLKTAVLRQVLEITGQNPADFKKTRSYQLDPKVVADIAASFQKTVVETLVKNTRRAAQIYNPATIVVGGGVAANKKLRSELNRAVPDAIFVPNELCGDNAAMIAALGTKMLEKGIFDLPFELRADSSLETL